MIVRENWNHRPRQGTGAVNLAAVLSGVAASGLPLREHRIVVFGAGTAGIGVADQLRDALVADGLSPEQATARIWALDRHGLLTAGQRDIRDFQLRYARAAADVEGWHHDDAISGIPLAEVVTRVRPTILIGTSGQGGAFTEDIVRTMAVHADRPIILPMSNPTRLAEAVPADLLAWSEGRALIATGSPFGPVDQGGVTYQVGQANNALVFPGLGLGGLVSEADRVTDAMLNAAAHAVAAQTDATVAGAPILPLITQLHETSVAVAVAVARAAADDGVAHTTVDERIEERIRAAMWTPSYRPIRAV